jgi:choline dehydrogenase-like flavoprotein
MGRTIECYDIIVWSMIEQALNPDSRIRLSNATDRFGQRRAVLDWRLSDLDYHTMRTAAVALGRRLAETNVGRVQVADWLREKNPTPPGIGSDAEPPIHHMCTTRMSDDPRSGVVDKDCRVHGLENLYIGGSSVFATSSHAHPTFTIVQLALRLAEHLDVRLRR